MGVHVNGTVSTCMAGSLIYLECTEHMKIELYKKISVHDNMHQPQRREDCPALSFSLLIYYDRELTAINCRVCFLVDVTVCHVHRQTIDEDNLEGLLVKEYSIDQAKSKTSSY